MEATQPGYNTGYLHRNYAHSLAEIGQPRHLPNADGWILRRGVHGLSGFDGMGCYPFLSCRDWTRLPTDVNDLDGDLITLTAVIDPLARVPLPLLEKAFPDLAAPYKSHFIIDLALLETAIGKQHARKARRALGILQVEQAPDPTAALDDWTRLYANLIHKHKIVGLSAFSKASFALQMRVPGLFLFEAREGQDVVGATMWFTDGPRVYYHLGASSERGYALGASFALFQTALQSFAQQGYKVALLGAGAGVHNDGTDGLSRFKAGWASRTAKSFLCGRIFDKDMYRQLSAGREAAAERYFPLYRHNLQGV